VTRWGVSCWKHLWNSYCQYYGPVLALLRNREELQHYKGYIWQAYTQHHTKWGKIEIISSKVRSETRVSTLSTVIQHSLGIPIQSNKTGRRKKRKTNKKVRSQTIPIADDMFLYLKDLKNSTKKTLLDIINIFIKIAGYKINLQKSVIFLYQQ
jgi:hypothetical protein